MDPLTILGAVSSVSQILELADKTSISAWKLTQSIIRAPTEIATIAAKLQHFSVLMKQLHLALTDETLHDPEVLFPTDYLEILYETLERNKHALESLRTLKFPTATNLPLKGRLCWAAVDKRKARAILNDIRDAEGCLDVAITLITLRLTLLNQASLYAIQSTQSMLLPALLDAMAKVDTSIEQRILEVKNEIILHTASTQMHMGHSMLQTSNQLNRQSHTNAYSPKCSLADAQRPELGARGSSDILSYELKRTRGMKSFTLGSLDSWPSADLNLSKTSTKAYRSFRLILRLRFRLMQHYIIRFEMALRSNTRHWMSTPSLSCSFTIVNVRPTDAPIFEACFDWDLNRVRYLLDTGQASILDVDDNTRRGLLEHVLHTAETFDIGRCSPPPEKFQGQLVLDYLLSVGCNPNIFNGLHSLPAILHAFCFGDLDSVNRMICHGGDIGSFALNPSSLLHPGFHSTPLYYQKLHLLRTLGFSDWQVGHGESLLHAAAVAGDWTSLLFALVIAKLDANVAEVTTYENVFFSISDISHRAGVAGALIEDFGGVDNGDQSWLGSPVMRTIRCDQPDLTHFFLYRGASISLTNCHGETPWYVAWNWLLNVPDFEFDRQELLFTHLLLHNADPFQVAEYTHLDSVCQTRSCDYTYPWFGYFGQIKSSEMARAWTYSGDLHRVQYTDSSHRQYLESSYEAFEANMSPASCSTWCQCGRVHRQDYHRESIRDCDVHSGTSKTCLAEKTKGDPNYSGAQISYADPGQKPSHYPCETHHDDHLRSAGENDEVDTGSGCSSRLRHDRFGVSSFQHVLSTSEGRQQMSTFPAVRLLCNALNRAGYRAEMDLEGDIWYEEDDGDRYYEAREFQAGEECAAECFICQDMSRYGFGEFVACAEEGVRRLKKYKDEVKVEKRKWAIV
ncbi:hypothetical protein F5Y19DRAFT_427785 [Xylariaceae sp. FL1651]|nr:hypothetical protein F5Y19DRAFT_427785 [Xylariaceae sp. FL1651]